LPLLFIYTVVLLMIFVGDPKIERPIFAMASIFMWLKFLYFLRIFKGTGYLISLIIEVISDMKVFLSILLITLFAFGHCFLILSLNNDESD